MPLIPRYFDLLCLLLARRGEALSRREILDAVWSDVVVSDGALSQAIRTLRRALDDDPRDPKFIRTVQRHGYRFVFDDVVVEPDEEALTPRPVLPRSTDGASDVFEASLDLLLRPTSTDDARREAAERLHTAGTAATLEHLEGRTGQARARAFLRDARWAVPGAGTVPILGRPGALAALGHLLALRWRRVLRLAGGRWIGSVLGAATSGAVAGFAGALLLLFGPTSTATSSILVALPVVGLAIGGLGAVGVGAGLSAAEVTVRSRRGLALVAGGFVGGGLIGAVTHLFGRLTLEGIFGARLEPVGGGLEGCVLGGAVGLGYALATPMKEGGMAAPRSTARLRAGVLAAGCGALAAAALASTGSYLGAMSLDLVAHRFPDSQIALDPLARLLGESVPGPRTRLVISAFEGWMFGGGLVLGLTRRPR